jgi:hypothetical protein
VAIFFSWMYPFTANLQTYFHCSHCVPAAHNCCPPTPAAHDRALAQHQGSYDHE